MKLMDLYQTATVVVEVRSRRRGSRRWGPWEEMEIDLPVTGSYDSDRPEGEAEFQLRPYEDEE